MAVSRRRKKVSRKRRGRKRGRSNGNLYLALVIALLVGVNLYVFLWRGGTSIPDVMERAAVADRSLEFQNTGADGKVANPSDPKLVVPREVEIVRKVDERVQAGDSMGQILNQIGATPNEADSVIRALTSELDLRSIRPGQKYSAEFDDIGLHSFSFRESRVRGVAVKRVNIRGDFEATRADKETKKKTERIEGTIRSSLFQAVQDAGHDTSIVPMFVDVFAFDLNFFVDQHPNDRFSVLVESRYVDGRFFSYEKILAAEYVGVAGKYRAFLWKPPGRNETYFAEDGQALERTFLKSPLKYARVSSRFSSARMHPILHTSRGHYGVDYAAAKGTPVWAAAPGKIVFRGVKGGGGNVVEIDHRNGYRTTYMHLSKFAAGQIVGQRVKRKDVIGFVGTTGLSTGPHLHFGVKKNGHHVDPLSMPMEREPGVAPEDFESFKNFTAKSLKKLGQEPALEAVL